MEKTENTTDYAADGVDLGAGDTTMVAIIDTITGRVICTAPLLSYSQFVIKAVDAEIQAYNETPTLPSWTKHSPHEGFRCACQGANGYVPRRDHPSGLGGQMVYGSLKRQLEPGESTPGAITVDSRGNGEAVAIKLEEMGLKITRVYPRGGLPSAECFCSGVTRKPGQLGMPDTCPDCGASIPLAQDVDDQIGSNKKRIIQLLMQILQEQKKLVALTRLSGL